MGYSESQTQCFKDCSYKFWLRELIGLRPRTGGIGHSLRFGKAIDSALQVLYKSDYSHADEVDELPEIADAACVAFSREFPRDQYPLPSSMATWDVGKTFENGIQAIGDYIVRYREEDQDRKTLSIEQGETFDDGTVVHLDWVWEYTDGSIIGTDHKTTYKYIDGDYWDRFQLNSQVRRYTDFIAQKHGHCEGFEINAIMFKYRSKAYNRGEDRRPGKTYWRDFGRMIYKVTDNAIAIERRNRAYWDRQIEQAVADGVFGQNTDQCWKCEYRGSSASAGVCQYGYEWPRDRELIEANYYQRCGGIVRPALRACELEVGHDGPCSEMPVTAPVEEAVEYEVAED